MASVAIVEGHCEKLAEGISGAEGPVVDLSGRIFLVSSNAGTILQVLPDGQLLVHAETGGIPAGLQVDHQNNLWCADMKLGILRISPQGEIFPEVTEFEGSPIRGCNDCFFDSRGNLFFSAPAGSGRDKPLGEVYCRWRDGSVTRLDGRYCFSNGLAVSRSDDLLIVAETFTRSLWAYPLDGEKIGKRFLWATLPEGEGLGPDGMDFDSDGNLLVAHVGAGMLEVFSPRGALVERVRVPFAKLSNLHFMGNGSRELLLTDMTNCALWKMPWRTTGQPQFCHLAGPLLH